MRISKWGNSLAVRLPATLLETLELEEGDDIMLVPVQQPKTFQVIKNTEHEAALTALRTFRGRLPTGFRFSRDEANAR